MEKCVLSFRGKFTDGVTEYFPCHISDMLVALTPVSSCGSKPDAAKPVT